MDGWMDGRIDRLIVLKLSNSFVPDYSRPSVVRTITDGDVKENRNYIPTMPHEMAL